MASQEPTIPPFSSPSTCDYSSLPMIVHWQAFPPSPSACDEGQPLRDDSGQVALQCPSYPLERCCPTLQKDKPSQYSPLPLPWHF